MKAHAGAGFSPAGSSIADPTCHGTAGRQTVLHVNDRPAFEGSWEVVVEPIRSESALRQRAWVEDNASPAAVGAAYDRLLRTLAE